jgi:hypothetical protein
MRFLTWLSSRSDQLRGNVQVQALTGVEEFHAAGGELEQTQCLLGHVSVQTTEKYLGCKRQLRAAVNDQIGIEPRA